MVVIDGVGEISHNQYINENVNYPFLKPYENRMRG